MVQMWSIFVLGGFALFWQPVFGAPFTQFPYRNVVEDSDFETLPRLMSTPLPSNDMLPYLMYAPGGVPGMPPGMVPYPAPMWPGSVPIAAYKAPAAAPNPPPASDITNEGKSLITELQELMASNNFTRSDIEKLIYGRGNVTAGPNGSTLIHLPGNATLLHREIVREQVEVRKADTSVENAAAVAGAAQTAGAAAKSEGSRIGITKANVTNSSFLQLADFERIQKDDAGVLENVVATNDTQSESNAAVEVAAGEVAFPGEGVVQQDVITVNGEVTSNYTATAEPLKHNDEHGTLAIRRKVECPPGFILEGKRCSKTDTIAAELMCPVGTSDDLSPGRCLSLIAGARACAPGLVPLPNGQCTVPEGGIPARAYCETGLLEAGGCRVTEDLPFKCPDGFEEMFEDRCIRLSPIEKVCPPGYKLNGKNCARRIGVVPSITCPPDTEFSNGECIRLVQIPPHCEAGFALDGDLCVGVIEREKAECPAGFAYHEGDGMCVREVESAAIESCAPDHHLEDHQCILRIPQPLVCPEGTVQSRLGECERPTEATPSCLEDEVLQDDSTCHIEKYFVPDLVCDEGYTLFWGKCKKVDVSPAPLYCTAGTLDGDVCIEEKVSPVRVTCPRGTSMTDEGDCAREVSYDCSQAVTTTECELPNFIGEVVRMTGPDYKAKAAPFEATPHIKGSIVEKAHGSPDSKEPVCQQVTRVINRTCSRLEFAQPSHSCRPGTVLNEDTGTCTESVTLQPIRACEEGYFDVQSANCVKFETVPANKQCPRGELQDDHACFEEVVRPADLICLEPAQPRIDHCAIIEELVEQPDEVLVAEPALSCAAGADLIDGVCKLRETAHLPEVCPANSVERDGTCIISVPLIYSPPLQLRTLPVQKCLDGQPAEIDAASQTAQCWREEVADIVYVCREGVHQHGRCVLEAPKIAQPPKVAIVSPKPLCPPGFELRETRCFTDQIFEPLLQCPPGYAVVDSPVGPGGAGSFDSNQKTGGCAKEIPKIATCPAGASRTQDGACSILTVIAPRVTEIKVCTKGAPGC